MPPCRYLAGWAVGCALLSAGCQHSPPPETEQTSPLRLIDLFQPQSLETVDDPISEGNADPVSDPRRSSVSWRLAEGEVKGWQAAVGIASFTVEQGLKGRSESEFPLLQGTFDGELDELDLVHSVEVRLRASAGTGFGLQMLERAPDDLRRLTRPIFPWPFEAALIADGESHLYTLKPQGMRPVRASQARHLFLRPTDVAEADFTVESIRVILRQEHLASIASGIGWHGMESIYRETLVSREGEVLRFPLRLPQAPRLDVALASLDAEPATFSVAVEHGGEVTEVLAETPAQAHRWQVTQADLTPFAGQEVDLLLRLTASDERRGARRLGFWGTPVVRGGSGGAATPAAGAPAAGTPAAGAAKPRGVIVLLADTLRRDHLSFYGYGRDTAPVLASLVEEGTLVEDAIAQATWTKASVPSIFTSMYPSTHGVEHFTDRLPASAETMAEVFRQAGYATLGLSSITFTGKFTNLHQGYEEFHESSSLPSGHNSKNARYYVDRLMTWLDEHRDVPFFVFLHVADPHSPYEPYAPYDTLWSEEGDRDAYLAQQSASREFIENPLMRAFGMPKRQELVGAGLDPEAYVDFEIDAYDGSIRGMDAEIGRLVDHLRQLGLDDEVVLAFVSDHGTEFLDHGYHFHGHSVFGELNRVPMFFWGPGFVPPGRRIPGRVQTIDLMPTVLDLAGLERPSAVQGQSLVPWMLAATGETPDRLRVRPAFTEKAQHLSGASPQDAASMSFAMLAGDWKLVHHVERPDERPEFQLFQPSTDPLDQRDVAADHPQVVQRLAAELAAWRQQATAQRLSDDGLTEGLSGEEMERLRSLGYL